MDNNINQNCDTTYNGDASASIAGAMAFIISTVLIIEIGFYQFLESFSIVALIWKIIAVFWVVKIAKRQNRMKLGWGLFAFISPSIALIIIGLLKRANDIDNLTFQKNKQYVDAISLNPIIRKNEKLSSLDKGIFEHYEVEFNDQRKCNFIKVLKSNEYTYDFSQYFATENECINYLYNEITNANSC